MLEDELEDIITKALRGKELSWNELGISSQDLNKLSENEIVQIASRLELSAKCLIQLNDPFSSTQLPTELEMITSEYGHLGVNAFYFTYSGQRFLVDTGTELGKLKHVNPDYVLITHEHADHVACFSQLSGKVLTPSNWSPISGMCLETFDVSGHCTPALAYYFPELEVCFVGDAIFRRSMGGCRSSSAYQTALTNVRSMLTQLPQNTILCVGHGPNTTVAEERKENPFFA
jgi:hydroxyacylglutathione hydrolase